MKFRGGSISIEGERRSLLVRKNRVMTKKARNGSGEWREEATVRKMGIQGRIDPDLGKELDILEEETFKKGIFL